MFLVLKIVLLSSKIAKKMLICSCITIIIDISMFSNFYFFMVNFPAQGKFPNPTFNHFLKPVFPIAKSHINFLYKKFGVKLLCPKFCIIQWKPFENMMSGCLGILKKHESVSKQASKKLVNTITQERREIKTSGFLHSICMALRKNPIVFGEVWTR